MFKREQSILRIMNGSKEVLRGMKKQGLYTLEVEVVSGSEDVASIKHVPETELGTRDLAM